jgi:hypothetical protein
MWRLRCRKNIDINVDSFLCIPFLWLFLQLPGVRTKPFLDDYDIAEVTSGRFLLKMYVVPFKTLSRENVKMHVNALFEAPLCTGCLTGACI